MGRDNISNRQWLVMVATALLMPAIELLPTMTARLAGGAGWLSALGAVPVLLGAGWAANGMRKTERAKGGRILSNIIIIMYMLWTLLLLMLCLRLSAARLERIYGRTAAALCAAAVLAVAVWMALGKLSAFARAGEIFYLALVVMSAGILLLAAFEVEPANFAVKPAEWSALPRGAAVTAGLLLNVYPAVALAGAILPQKGSGRQRNLWVIVFCAVVMLLLGAVTGCLGPGLTGKLSSPFQIMVQGLGVQGAFQRTEALAAGMITLSDLMLVGVLLYAWRRMADWIHKGDWSRKSVVPVAAAAIAGGWVFFFEVETLWDFCSTVLPLLGFVLGFLCPILLRCVLSVRGKRSRG